MEIHWEELNTEDCEIMAESMPISLDFIPKWIIVLRSFFHLTPTAVTTTIIDRIPLK